MIPNQSIQIADGSIKGSVSSPGFSSKYKGDSIWVIFDNIYRITHYINVPVKLYPKNYIFSSLRNIGNPKSYRFVSTPMYGGKSYKNEHFYEFIEQDFLDAN